ncbi:MAG: hypothetical protein AB8I08_15855 [Sandaracinaceae bacterium]
MTRRTLIYTLATLLFAGLLATGATAQDTLSVREIMLGSQLEAGVPTAQEDSFARNSGAVYCVVRLNNPGAQETAVRIAFERAEGEPANRPAGHRLTVPARRRYRTLARSGTARAPGSYRCVVRDDEGTVLSSANYTITE